MFRLLSAVCLVASLILIGLATVANCGPPAVLGEPIPQPDREFPHATAGQMVCVTFSFHNQTNSAARVVGLLEC